MVLGCETYLISNGRFTILESHQSDPDLVTLKKIKEILKKELLYSQRCMDDKYAKLTPNQLWQKLGNDAKAIQEKDQTFHQKKYWFWQHVPESKNEVQLICKEIEKLTSQENPNLDLTRALQLALNAMKIKRVKSLLEAGADPNQKNSENKTALLISMCQHSLDKEGNPKIDQNGRWKLIDPEKRASIIKMLLEYEADANVVNAWDDYSPLMLYLDLPHSFSEVVEMLCKKTSNVNYQSKQDGKTALHVAASKNMSTAARILLKYGADPNVKTTKSGRTPLHEATIAKQVSEKIVNGDNDDFRRYINLSLGSPETLEYLCERGGDVNAQDMHGNTPLHLAVRVNRFEIAEILIQHKANPILKNNEGKSALELANEMQADNEEILAMIELLSQNLEESLTMRTKV